MRIVMYWHNGRSLGHTAGSAKIAHELVNQMPEAYVSGLTGAWRGLDLLPAAMDVVKLPAFVNYDNVSGWNTGGRQGFEKADLFSARAEMCDTFLSHYQPDLLMVNHLPRGAEDELVSALKGKRHGFRALTLRGVLFDKEKTHREYFSPTASQWIEDNFDAIWVYTDPEIFRLEEFYQVSDSLQRRLRYVGYLAEPLPLTKEFARNQLGIEPGERVVVASMGGGQGACDIWFALIEALQINQQCFDRAILVTGPYLEQAVLQELAAKSALLPWLEIRSYDPQLTHWMLAADLVVAAAGSNMLGEILANRCNAVVIPRQVREDEQRIHASLLEARGIVRLCSLEQVHLGRLRTLLPEALASPISAGTDLKVGGAREFPRLINQLVANV